MIQPLTVATLAICIVFFPVLLLTGPSRFLFIPLAITVVLAMLASYVLSFTVVPALARYLLKDHDDHAPKNLGARMSAAFDRGFERVKNGYGNVLALALRKRKFVLGCFALLIAATGVLAPVIGTDFFPTSDVGILKMHVRAPRGMRLEETEKIVAAGRGKHPPDHPGEGAAHHQFDHRPAVLAQSCLRAERQHQRHGCGTPDFAQSRPPADGGIPAARPRQAQRRIPRHAVLLPDGRHRQPGAQLRLAAPIDIQIEDSNFARAYASAQRILALSRESPAWSILRIAQVLDFPTIQIDVDRQRAARHGHRPARRRQQHAHVACRQRAGRRDLLSQSDRPA